MTFSAQIKGGKSLSRNLEKLKQTILVEAGKSYFDDGELLADVAETLTPVLTASLRLSVFTTLPKTTKNTVKVTVGFGDDNVNPISGRKTKEYAFLQHENLEYRHPRGGQAKFLTMPFEGMKPQIVKNVIRRVNRAVRIKF